MCQQEKGPFFQQISSPYPPKNVRYITLQNVAFFGMQNVHIIESRLQNCSSIISPRINVSSQTAIGRSLMEMRSGRVYLWPPNPQAYQPTNQVASKMQTGCSLICYPE